MHGYNKFFGPSGLKGTAGWFDSIGMRWPSWQARLAATTEVASGLLLAVGFLTPLAAAGMIGVMTVAIVVAHAKVGFFIFKPGQGWEYCASIAVAAWVIATVGPGELVHRPCGRYRVERLVRRRCCRRLGNRWRRDPAPRFVPAASFIGLSSVGDRSSMIRGISLSTATDVRRRSRCEPRR